MQTIVLASANQHKIKEFKKILKEFNIITMKDIGFSDEIIENGETFAQNAEIKSSKIHEFCVKNGLNYMVLADDSGLIVNSLNGEPGVFSARYSGEHGNDKANRDKVISNLENFMDRSASFICSLCLIKENGEKILAEGRTDGIILNHEEGYDGFGYDCIFFSEDLGKTFGCASEEEKNSVSHRGRALKELREKLKKEKMI